MITVLWILNYVDVDYSLFKITLSKFLIQVGFLLLPKVLLEATSFYH